MRQPQLGMLRAHYLIRRGLLGSTNPSVQRMRQARNAFYLRTWQRAAHAAGAKCSLLSDSIAEITSGGHRLRISGSTTSLDDPATLQLAGDKPAVYRLLVQAGIPVPRHIVLATGAVGRLDETLRALPLPLVIKPAADTGGGDGVSTNITTLKQLRHAVAWACAYGRRILIETQIEGDCYRVLLLDGEVLDAVRRRRSRVVGDGRSTIRRLIAAENDLRLSLGTERAQVLIRRDPDLVATLASQGLSLCSRPAKGNAVELKRVINDNRADENEAADGVLCPAILATARGAANAIGVRLAGVDVICRDPGVPLEQSGGAIIDVNATPGFYYHYHRRGASCAVADHILQRIFAAAQTHAG